MIGTTRAALILSAVLISTHYCRAAIVLDLTSPGASGTINGAIYKQVDPQPTGTGVINTFLRIQKRGVEEGFNTNFRPAEFDEKGGVHSRALLLSDVPQVLINGVTYREFLLDLNETSSQPLISLNEVKIFLAGSPDMSTLASFGTPIYQMDASEEASVKLNYSLGSGSGSGDVLMFVPSSMFVGEGAYVYLYSRFGESIAGDGSHVGASAGFEEWAAGRIEPGGTIVAISGPPAPVPEPGMISVLVLLGFGLMGRARR